MRAKVPTTTNRDLVLRQKAGNLAVTSPLAAARMLQRNHPSSNQSTSVFLGWIVPFCVRTHSSFFSL